MMKEVGAGGRGVDSDLGDRADPAASDVLRVERRGHVASVMLHRPERLNALDVRLMEALRAAWPALARDPGVRAIVLTGAGRGFCSGADAELLAGDRADARTTVRDELSFLPGEHVEVPVVVAVNGVCAGGGLHFVADADIAIAGGSASFVDPHVSVGQVSALEPVSLRWRMRQDMLARMVLLGRTERLDAKQAYEAGLISEVVDDDRLQDRAWELAERIAANSTAAVRRSRAVLRAIERQLLERHLEEGWRSVRDHWQHPDAAEGPAAFLERRVPRWAEPDPDL